MHGIFAAYLWEGVLKYKTGGSHIQKSHEHLHDCATCWVCLLCELCPFCFFPQTDQFAGHQTGKRTVKDDTKAQFLCRKGNCMKRRGCRRNVSKPMPQKRAKRIFQTQTISGATFKTSFSCCLKSTRKHKFLTALGNSS